MRDNIRKALDFAIAKEAEAELLYKTWAEVSVEPAVRRLFAELGAAEHDHAEMLRHVVPGDLIGRRDDVADLGLSDALRDVPPSPSMTLPDALTLAMQREDLAVRLYDRLAELGGEPAALFRSLARVERSHKRRLEEAYGEETLREH
jgi:rubrerythrin